MAATGHAALPLTQPKEVSMGRYGASWQNVTGVLPPRMVKLGIQVDF